MCFEIGRSYTSRLCTFEANWDHVDQLRVFEAGWDHIDRLHTLKQVKTILTTYVPYAKNKPKLWNIPFSFVQLQGYSGLVLTCMLELTDSW